MKAFLVLFAMVVLSAGGGAEAFPFIKNGKANPLNQDNQDQFNFDGIVKLSNCSGALVRFNVSLPHQKALVLTNGHCVDYNSDTGYIPPDVFVSNQSTYRTFKFLNANGSFISGAVLKSKKLVYATMTGTDLSVYQLALTYEEIEQKFGVHALTLSSEHPSAATPVYILSGYFQSGYSCAIDRFVYLLREGDYKMYDAIRYAGDCDTTHGTSGSPILNALTREVIGIHNTGNDDGERCTLNNPCEVSQDGDIYVKKNQRYGQQTYLLYSCLNSNAEIDLTIPGCLLLH